MTLVFLDLEFANEPIALSAYTAVLFGQYQICLDKVFGYDRTQVCIDLRLILTGLNEAIALVLLLVLIAHVKYTNLV
jgi:hypothetical protein